MVRTIALLLIAGGTAWAQFPSSNRLVSGDGVPSVTTCTKLADVGKTWVRRYAMAAASSLYVCSQTGVGVFTWELQGSGSMTYPSGSGFSIVSSGASWGTTLTDPLAAGHGGTGVANTATLTLGSSNVNWATLGTGIMKNTTQTGAHTLATYSDVVGLWTTCTGYLKSDGTCVALTTMTYPSNSGFSIVSSGASWGTTLADPLTVGHGGTGLATLTAHALYAGNATSAPTAIGPDSSTTKALFSGGASADPGFRAIATADLSAAERVRVCEIAIGDPGAASPALADDNDIPSVCANLTGETMTILEVKCYANTSTGSPTILPIITGGASTSILSGGTPLACGNGAFGSAGTLNGTPTQTDGSTIDGNISTAGGTAKYIIIRIKRTL